MRQIKLIHAADLHLDSSFESLSDEAAEKRREGQRKLLFKIAELAENCGAQAVLLCGDVFDSDAVSKSTEEAFCRAFAALAIPVFVSPGNHDPYTPSSVWARMALPANVYVFKRESVECQELPEVNLRVWGAGFENNFCKPILDGFSAPDKSMGLVDVMVIHGDVYSGKSDYNPITSRQIESSGMDYIALGHIHNRSTVQTVGSTAFAYPGCTEGRGYDEIGETGAFIVTISDNGAAAELIPLGGSRYDILKINISAGNALAEINKASLDYTDKDYLRIVLTGECEELPDTAALRRELEGRFAELQLRDETVKKRDVWELVGQDSLTGLFLEKLRAMLDTSKTDEERRVIELAARYGLAALESGGVK